LALGFRPAAQHEVVEKDLYLFGRNSCGDQGFSDFSGNYAGERWGEFQAKRD
jgi:hypothetical protein